MATTPERHQYDGVLVCTAMEINEQTNFLTSMR